MAEFVHVWWLTELAVIRQQVNDSFQDSHDEANDLKIMDRLTAVENQIEKAIFETDADKRVGNSILMEDNPKDWCCFRVALFLRMQEFA